jgi:branched-chain amino acid transport system permease protein
MAAFALSAFIAGLGGALLAIHQGNVNYTNNFSPFGALFWLVLVMAIGSRAVGGAAVAGGAFALFDTVILRGTFLGWILRSPDRIPGFFPVSPKWRFVLFGLGTIQFARHPEGAVEAQRRKRVAARAQRERAAAEPAPPGGRRAEADADAEVAEPVG